MALTRNLQNCQTGKTQSMRQHWSWQKMTPTVVQPSRAQVKSRGRSKEDLRF